MAFSHETYCQRRQALLDQLPEGSVVCIYSGDEKIRNRDVEYPFRAESDFWYLTGFTEPEAVLVLRKTAQKSESWLFLRPKDPEQETWQGRRLGVEAAPKALGVDRAFDHAELDERASDFLSDCQSVWVSFSHFGFWAEHFSSWLGQLKPLIRKGVATPTGLNDLDTVLHEQRLIKSGEEIEVMRRAAKATIEGHLAAMRAAAPTVPELTVQAEVEAAFMRNGSPRVAFGTIVAGGENACILHYTDNADVLRDGDLVLVDAGAEIGGYAGDITTTFPVSGRFSPAQKQLYELVLKAQQAAIAVIKPGISYEAMHQASSRVITEGLIELGILQGDLEALLKDEAYKPYFMHGTGHWLGMDVHDVGVYKVNGQWRTLQPGMVVTVEPGLYISQEQTEVDERWHGIGIRIEDDVVVTADGYEILTQGLPRNVEEIERFLQSRQA